MPKGQLSRVPWPGTSWMPFTFQFALRALQQPHKQSHSLQLATHTELAHHYIQYALSTLTLSPRVFLQSTTWPHQSTEMALERATSPIKVAHPPCLLRLSPWENVNRSTTLYNLPYVSEIILLIIHERKYEIFVDAVFPTLNII